MSVVINTNTITGRKRAHEESVDTEESPLKRTNTPTPQRVTPAFFASCLAKAIAKEAAELAAAVRDLASDITDETRTRLFPGKGTEEVFETLTNLADTLESVILGATTCVKRFLQEETHSAEQLATFKRFVSKYLPDVDQDDETTADEMLQFAAELPDCFVSPSKDYMSFALSRLVNIKVAVSALLYSGDLATGLEDLGQYLLIEHANAGLERAVRTLTHTPHRDPHLVTARAACVNFETVAGIETNPERYEAACVGVFVNMLSLFPRELRVLASWLSSMPYYRPKQLADADLSYTCFVFADDSVSDSEDSEDDSDEYLDESIFEDL